MRKIYVGDGGSFVWQWQPKEHIVLEGYPDGVFVHFANCSTKEAPVVQSRRVGDHLIADIPPELMQVDKDITVYVCDTDGTRQCYFLSVISRPKPASYVYEPVEVLRYESLAAKIPFSDSYNGKLLYVVDGIARPLELGPGLEIRDGMLYVTGAGPEEPDEPVEGVSVTLGEDGTLLLSCAADLGDDGTIILPVPVTLTADGTIMIGGAA
jgi:hypothetical protein